MITYEASLICDNCGEGIVHAEPNLDYLRARDAVIRFALDHGWKYTGSGQDLCPKCNPEKKPT